MSYKEQERKKAIRIRDELLRDPGSGLFRNKERPFVLQDPRINLWAGIRHDAIDYFERNKIPWWMGADEEPTGHLLSSQISCLNHLYHLRQRKDLATALLKGLDSRITDAEILDDGYVEFEVVGKVNHLNEKHHTRGANSTSIDAAMAGRKRNAENLLVLIEWKYTEEYSPESKYIPERSSIYDRFLNSSDGPIITNDVESIYYEPFYQLMRQTLLGWRMVEAREYDCDEFLHVHVIPDQNVVLRSRITSPGLPGKNMSEAWQSVLRNKESYKVVTPEQLLSPITHLMDCKSVISYLEERYWK